MINAVSDVLALTKSLIKCQSVTPEDAGCQDLLSVRLKALDFKIEKVDFADVQNLWAKRGTASPLFVFLGHTDVVPPGPGADWLSPAFEPTVKDGYLFGRGAADMKGNIAAFVVACERFVSLNPQHKGSIALLLTSDEEGPAVNGTVRVLEQLAQRQEKIDYCLVGEPSSAEKVGDVLKNGRRGSFHGRLYVEGIQGHVAYPELAANPIHSVVAGLAELCARQWDKGNEFFPATSFQISNIKSGTGAENVIPGGLECWFNFRFSTESTPEQLKKVVHEILDKHGIKYSIDWRLSGAPFLTAEGVLLDAIKESIKEVNGSEPQLSTAGGTSDGRFVAPYGVQVVELGLVNSTIHKVNESVCVEDLETLSRIYQLTLEKILL